jgi:hypothetical protein
VATTGTLDLAVLSLVTDAARASGPVRFNVAATGPRQQPQVRGEAVLTDGSVVVDDPAAIAIENLGARLDVAGARLTLRDVGGLVNGGALSGSGTIAIGAGVIEDADLQLAVDDLAFSPLDLRSLSDVGLRLSRRDDTLVVAGDVRITEAGLTGDINFDTGVLGVIGRPRGLDLTAERSALLERIRFDVHVGTETRPARQQPAHGRTHHRHAGARHALRLGMSVAWVAPKDPPSRSTSAATEWSAARSHSPTTAASRRRSTSGSRPTRNYDITLAVSGEVGATETALTANPSLPEPDIMALLVTEPARSTTCAAKSTTWRERRCCPTSRAGSARRSGADSSVPPA